MPSYHNIACNTCKEFMGTYKWSVPFGRLEQPVNPVPVEAIRESIDRAIETWSKSNPSHWFNRIEPFLESFFQVHQKHELYFYLEGDVPWYPEEPSYTEWKEIGGSEITAPTEYYLPRNLIDDLEIDSWDRALKLLQGNTIMLVEDIDLKLYKNEFESLLRDRQ